MHIFIFILNKNERLFLYGFIWISMTFDGWITMRLMRRVLINALYHWWCERGLLLMVLDRIESPQLSRIMGGLNDTYVRIDGRQALMLGEATTRCPRRQELAVKDSLLLGLRVESLRHVPLRRSLFLNGMALSRLRYRISRKIDTLYTVVL